MAFLRVSAPHGGTRNLRWPDDGLPVMQSSADFPCECRLSFFIEISKRQPTGLVRPGAPGELCVGLPCALARRRPGRTPPIRHASSRPIYVIWLSIDDPEAGHATPPPDDGAFQRWRLWPPIILSK